MIETKSFSTLMERLHSGEDAAAREVYHRFAGRLVALARRRFDRRLAHRVDPEDVVQSAFESFFVRHRAEAFRLDGWEDLWGLLTVITRRECVDRVDYLLAQRRDVRREAAAPDGEDSPWHLAPGREPGPEEAAALAEAVEHLLRSVDDDDRAILELTLEGYTAVEIGQKLGRPLRSVQRLRERVRKRLERHALEGAGVGD